ncbi:DUF5694 domain-containing protein [Natrialba swarupiae]|uniref:Phenylacetate--CoA ligase n=1 Tax=Natrialba swarupiae TaxID=2448032 RepID=A0A5D5AHS2_9EURY|nr:DUF5694 domain-containing protein [Natrialba swarupiae]TYT61408.1 phenylacetate--CoA ligase [Natrialba swarupiae]
MNAELALARRQFLATTAVGTTAETAGCTGPAGRESVDEVDDAWPAPREGKRRVMLFGSTHLQHTADGDGGNVFAVDPGDVLEDDRQRELADLVDRLATWDPDRVAVEWPSAEQEIIDEAYTDYRDGGIEALPERLDPTNEIVQIGFRLADRLDHEPPAAVDYPQNLTALLESEETPPSFESLLPDPADVAYPLPALEETIAEDQRLLDEGTLLEYHRHLNDPDRARWNDELLFAAALEGSDLGEYPATSLLTAWYQRNIRIAANLWNGVDGERVLLVIGASHVPGLRHLLTVAPMFVPVSPLPSLE